MGIGSDYDKTYVHSHLGRLVALVRFSNKLEIGAQEEHAWNGTACSGLNYGTLEGNYG
jgi:hypothetical protein